MRKPLALAALVTLFALAAGPAPAATGDGIRVEPGLWEFSSSIPDPASGSGGPQTYRTCVRDRTITPQRVMAMQKECRLWNAVFTGPSARWKMRCETPAGPMTGSGSLRSSGTAVAGTVDLTMALGSLEVPISGDFRGRRVGACR